MLNISRSKDVTLTQDRKSQDSTGRRSPAFCSVRRALSWWPDLNSLMLRKRAMRYVKWSCGPGTSIFPRRLSYWRRKKWDLIPIRCWTGAAQRAGRTVHNTFCTGAGGPMKDSGRKDHFRFRTRSGFDAISVEFKIGFRFGFQFGLSFDRFQTIRSLIHLRCIRIYNWTLSTASRCGNHKTDLLKAVGGKSEGTGVGSKKERQEINEWLKSKVGFVLEKESAFEYSMKYKNII